jgi:hypothetical protein
MQHVHVHSPPPVILLALKKEVEALMHLLESLEFANSAECEDHTLNHLLNAISQDSSAILDAMKTISGMDRSIHPDKNYFKDCVIRIVNHVAKINKKGAFDNTTSQAKEKVNRVMVSMLRITGVIAAEDAASDQQHTPDDPVDKVNSQGKTIQKSDSAKSEEETVVARPENEKDNAGALKKLQDIRNEKRIEEEKKRMEVERLKKAVQDAENKHAEDAKLASYNHPMNTKPPRNSMRPVQDTILAQNQRAMLRILNASGSRSMPFVYKFSYRQHVMDPNMYKMMINALNQKNPHMPLSYSIHEADIRNRINNYTDASINIISQEYAMRWLMHYTGNYKEPTKLNLGSTITNNNADDTVYRLFQCTDDPKLQGIIMLCCTESRRATLESPARLKFTWIVPREIPGVAMASQCAVCNKLIMQ